MEKITKGDTATEIIKLKTERSGKGSSEEESSRCQVFRPFKLPYTLEEPGHTWGSARCSLATLFPSRDLNPGPPGSCLWLYIYSCGVADTGSRSITEVK